MKKSYPPIYHQLRKSRLVDPDTLSEVCEELIERLRGLGLLPPEGESPETTEPDEPFDETDFDLGTEWDTSENDFGDFKFSDELPDTEEPELEAAPAVSESNSPSPISAELERMLPAELELRGLLNHWQVTQLLLSRTRFYLGPYRIVDSLGAGGYGQVFLGRTDLDPSNKSRKDSGNKRFTDVAIKVLPLTGANPKTIQKFRREININMELSHKNIVHFIQSAADGNVHYAVYEYMDGGTARLLSNDREPADIRIAAAVISETAKGLWYLHEKRIVHRDVKPGNILLSRQGEVKLADLGLAVPMDVPVDPVLDAAPNQVKRKVEGTSDYLSPDQILNPSEPSPMWDVYALGCTFYYLVTGIVPFPSGNSSQKIHAHLKSDAPDPRMFNQQLPTELAQLIGEMMDKSPEKRPSCDDRLIQRLRPWAASKGELARTVERVLQMTGQQMRPKAVQPVSLDDILDSATAFIRTTPAEETPAAETPAAETPAAESPAAGAVLQEKSREGGKSLPADAAAGEWDLTKPEDDESYHLRERLITMLAWCVLLPLSLAGLVLFIWILLRC